MNIPCFRIGLLYKKNIAKERIDMNQQKKLRIARGGY